MADHFPFSSADELNQRLMEQDNDRRVADELHSELEVASRRSSNAF